MSLKSLRGSRKGRYEEGVEDVDRDCTFVEGRGCCALGRGCVVDVVGGGENTLRCSCS
jgi:hypothetical protein